MVRKRITNENAAFWQDFRTETKKHAKSIRNSPSLDDLVRDYKTMEAGFISRAKGKSTLILETKRCIAECLLRAAIIRNEPFEVADKLFSDLCEIGFVNVQVKLDVYMIFARYSSWSGHIDEGIVMLRQLVSEMEDQRRRQKKSLFTRAINYVTPLIEELTRQKEQPGCDE
jgi:hypothetical protein